MARDIAVVGSGAAGLAAAWSLVEGGARVTLYDRREEVGGLLRTDTLAGAPVDVAVQLLGSYYTETLRLGRMAGGEGLLVPSPGRDALWRGGRAHRISYGSVASMATSGALPTALKLRLASRLLPFLREHSSILDPAEPVRAASLDHESIADWGRRELGDQFVELLAYPQLASYYGAEPEAVSAGFYHSLAKSGLALDLYAVRGGIRSLAESIADRLVERGAKLVLGAEIESVDSEDGVRIVWPGGEERHEAAVLAVPAPVVPEIIETPAPLASWLEGVRYRPELGVALALRRGEAADFFGLSFPRDTRPGRVIAAICIQSAKGAGLTGAENEAVMVVPAVAAQAQLLSVDPTRAVDSIIDALASVLPGISDRIVHAKVYRFPEGRVVFHPGYLTHLESYDPGWLSPTLALAGDYLSAPTVEGAVRSGHRAAARILSG